MKIVEYVPLTIPTIRFNAKLLMSLVSAAKMYNAATVNKVVRDVITVLDSV